MLLTFRRQLPGRWATAASPTWDEETEHFGDGPDTNVRTITAVGTITYELSRRFSLTTGLGKGFADTDNPGGSMQTKRPSVLTFHSAGASRRRVRSLTRA